MKNIITFALFLITAATASAQFKIHSNGFLSFMRPGSSLPKSPFTLAQGGGIGENHIFMSYKGDYCGLHFYTDEAAGSNNMSFAGLFRCGGEEEEINVGLQGIAYSSAATSISGNPASIGLWGNGYSNTQGRYAYGVLGTTYSGQTPYNSAAICGIATGNSLTSVIPDDIYAGLFVGKTKVVGDFTVTGSVNCTLLNNAPSTSAGNGLTRNISDEATTEKLQGLSLISYYNPQLTSEKIQPTFLEPDEISKKEMEKHGIELTKENEPNIDVIAQQIQEKEHYGLSVDELEKVLPNLVYTDKDGSKKVNYVEMVPLLVQCINELNARLSAVDGGNVGAGSVPARKEGTVETAIEAIPTKTQAVLYQNTPNPFTAQTEIRFSLPDDAPQAYIYIFDMTGKMQKQIPVAPSRQSVTINGYELQAGIYLYSLVVGGQEIDTKRMIITK